MYRVFDWRKFLDQHRIEYVTSGKNVKQGETNVCCPFCRSDPSFHLGTNPNTGYWCCWRNREEHSGKSPVRLIRALLRCSWEEAREIAGADTPVLDSVDGLRTRLRGLDLPGAVKDLPELEIPKEFKKVRRTGMTAIFWRFLQARGFPTKDIPKVCERYDLRCVMMGTFRYRLIFPVYVENKLVGWYARSVSTKTGTIRYLAFPCGEDSVGPRIIYNYDHAAEGGRALAIVEGPLDAVKLDFYGQSHAVRAVALLGVNTTPGKISLLSDLIDRHDRSWLVLDADAARRTLLTEAQLRVFRVGAWYLGQGDPGDLAPAVARAFACDLSRF